MNDLAIRSETSLGTMETRELTPNVWTMIQNMAPVMHQSRLFDVSSPAQAAAIILKGFEMGLSVSASFEFVQVIKGKPGLSPRGALALLHKSPEVEKIDIQRLENNNGEFVGYTCYMKRKSTGFEYTAKFTLEDARKAGLVKPDGNWEKYPENMCLWRAVGFAADVVAPDIVGGMTNVMKMPENYQFDNDGNVIDVNAETSTPHVLLTNTQQTTSAISLDDLVAEYGAEAVLQANAGKIPANDDEVREVAELLKA